MADTEFKNYDSNDEYRIVGARLVKDAEIRETTNGKMVRLTVVSTSRRKGQNGIIDMFVEVNVQDFNADMAAKLKKGDTIAEIKGKPYLREWGDESAPKVSFCLERAAVTITGSPTVTFNEVKERGWKPGQKSDDKKPAGNKKPANKKPAPRQPVEMPDDDIATE